MVRLTLLVAVVISPACAPKRAAVAPVTNHTEGPPRSSPSDDLLALDEGVTWHFAGTRTVDDGNGEVTTPIALVTVVDKVERSDGRVRYRVLHFPAYDDSGRATWIVVEDGVISLDGDPWFRVTPTPASPPCDPDGYCWSLEPGDDGGFDLYYRTGPDVSVYHLERGRGVTSYRYHHNGTTDEIELHRVDRVD